MWIFFLLLIDGVFIFYKENANWMQNIKLAWIFCWDAAFLLQRKCKWAQRKLAFNLLSAAFLLQRYKKLAFAKSRCGDYWCFTPFILPYAPVFTKWLGWLYFWEVVDGRPNVGGNSKNTKSWLQIRNQLFYDNYNFVVWSLLRNFSLS